VLVTAVEWSFSLSRTTVPAGKVVLQFADHGQDEHNLNLTSEGSLAGSLPDTNPGELRQLTLNMSAGSYTLFCSLPEHEQRGMKATLVVK
jgi:plastocyanin